MNRPPEELTGASAAFAFTVVCGLHRALNTDVRTVYSKMAATLWVGSVGKLCLVLNSVPNCYRCSSEFVLAVTAALHASCRHLQGLCLPPIGTSFVQQIRI